MTFVVEKINIGVVIMCESSAYILKDDKEELVMDSVAKITPLGNNELELVTLLGDRKVLAATIKEINLLRHKVILIPV